MAWAFQPHQGLHALIRSLAFPFARSVPSEFPVLEAFPDGSYRSEVRGKRKGEQPIPVRIVEYHMIVSLLLALRTGTKPTKRTLELVHHYLADLSEYVQREPTSLHKLIPIPAPDSFP